MNLNGNCWVKLTDYGVRCLELYYKNASTAHFALKPTKEQVPDKHGWSQFQLWEFANIFGTKLYNGAQSVVQNMEILFEDPREVKRKSPDDEEERRKAFMAGRFSLAKFLASGAYQTPEQDEEAWQVYLRQVP
jgi:hypothetical protein